MAFFAGQQLFISGRVPPAEQTPRMRSLRYYHRPTPFFSSSKRSDWKAFAIAIGQINARLYCPVLAAYAVAICNKRTATIISLNFMWFHIMGVSGLHHPWFVFCFLNQPYPYLTQPFRTMS